MMTDHVNRPNKRALLIGINSYPYLPPNSQLRGCVNDVNRMKKILEERFGFPGANITVLTNHQATEKGIREAMEKLVADCAEGDIVVFHFSGHGSRIQAANRDKASGYDETIMPSDSGRMNFDIKAPNRDIRDTEIQDWLSRLSAKTPHITLIFDSCHSGSITRWATDGTQEEGTRLRGIPPDSLPEYNQVKPASETARDVGGSGWLLRSDKYVLLAACAAEHGAFELDAIEDDTERRYGAFTYFLTQELSQPNQIRTYSDIWEQVVIKVAGRSQNQAPQLEGARNRKIFDVEDVAPMRYLPVISRRNDEVDLRGGAIHGLTKESLWEIYPAAPKQQQAVEAESRSCGTAEIISVKMTTATARIIKENFAGAIQPGDRAIELLHVDDEPLMPVWLSPAPDHVKEVEQLRQVLERSGMLEIKQTSTAAQAVIKLVVTEQAHSGQATPPSNAALPLWEVLNPVTQTLLMPRYPAEDSTSLHRIKDNLETIWRYKKVLEVRNDKSPLRDKIEFKLLKQGENGEWQEVSEGEDQAEPVYKHGELIAFRVVNRSGSTVYASVLDFGLSKRIGVLYPAGGNSEMVAPGRSGGAATDAATGGVFTVGLNHGDRIELYIPDHILAARSYDEPLRGKEVFKLVITTQQHDLSFLEQSGLRKGDERRFKIEHPLERLVYLAATGGQTREAKMGLKAEDDWITFERFFWLQKD